MTSPATRRRARAVAIVPPSKPCGAYDYDPQTGNRRYCTKFYGPRNFPHDGVHSEASITYDEFQERMKAFRAAEAKKAKRTGA